ncbi:MAG: hypothetical protein JSW59_06055 [Phycisphaerales bacterium]|nr:MAG: hypothetical protein JSW59_06055 [Phycisphaerales bacterium]
MEMKRLQIGTWLSLGALAITMLLVNTAGAAKVWSEGDKINKPIISTPSSGDKFGISSEVQCSCNSPTDSDDWCDAETKTGGSEPDTAVKATWTDGGAGGSFKDGNNTGPSVVYITPTTTGNVTLTVTFDDTGTTQYNDDPNSASVTIEVVGVKMIFKVGGTETSSITRAGSGTFEVVDSDGDPITGATYSDWQFDGEVDASEPTNTASTWGGTIVESGTASCNVLLGGNTIGVSKSITCNARTGWALTPTFAADNEAGWGTFPNWDTGCVYGRNRDRTTDGTLIIWPRGTNFQDGYTCTKVASGPNKDVWYISATTFVIDRESVINKFAKPGATGVPNPPNVNWHEYNESKSVDADGCLQGLKNHEARGTAGNGKGHQKFIEVEEAKKDVKAEIEDNVAASEAGLKTKTGGEVSTIDTAIYNAFAVEPAPGDNWGPATIYEYSFNNSKWDTKNYGN